MLRMLAGGYDMLILLSLAFLAFVPVSVAEHTWGVSLTWLKQALWTTLAFAYFAGFWVKGGATTGMRPWGLRVAMLGSGDYPTLSIAVLRCFGLCLTWLALGATLAFMAMRSVNHPLFFLSASIPAISLACMMLTPRRQALHDLLAGTAVFRVQDRS